MAVRPPSTRRRQRHVRRRDVPGRRRPDDRRAATRSTPPRLDVAAAVHARAATATAPPGRSPSVQSVTGYTVRFANHRHRHGRRRDGHGGLHRAQLERRQGTSASVASEPAPSRSAPSATTLGTTEGEAIDVAFPTVAGATIDPASLTAGQPDLTQRCRLRHDLDDRHELRAEGARRWEDGRVPDQADRQRHAADVVLGSHGLVRPGHVGVHEPGRRRSPRSAQAMTTALNTLDAAPLHRRDPLAVERRDLGDLSAARAATSRSPTTARRSGSTRQSALALGRQHLPLLPRRRLQRPARSP